MGNTLSTNFENQTNESDHDMEEEEEWQQVHEEEEEEEWQQVHEEQVHLREWEWLEWRQEQEEQLLEELQERLQQRRAAAAMLDQTDAYKRALAEGAMDVAYSRVLFLGTAGVGKTSFKRSLMKLPWKPSTTSTAVSDISKVRPFTHEWHTLNKDQWKVVSHEDEIEELAGLILAVYKKELEGSETTAYAHNKISQPVPEAHSKIIDEVDKIVSDALSYIKRNPTLPLKPQPFFHFWDCGGQPPFLEILPVFLTSRTLFFLIFDAEKDLKLNWKSVINIEGESFDQEEVQMTTLDYMLNWMANIHGHLMSYEEEEGGFCEFPRMYCIGTHGDRVKDTKSEIKMELEQHYQGKDYRALIEDTVIVDNTTSGQGEAEDSSLQALRDAIISFTEEKLVLKTPLSWILFRKVIQVLSKKHSVISLEDACRIGAASKIPVKDMHNVLMFYHELGVLLFYPQIDGMKNMIIINPSYIVDALGKIFPLSVSSPDQGRHCKEWKLFHECGILVQPLYVELWKKYKDASSEIFLKVLVHFRIAVEVKMDRYPPPSKQYFMPLVLKSTQVNSSLTIPSDSIQAAPLHITFNSGYVPPGFFTRFVVVLANEIELCFEKGVYRNCVTFRYQDPNSTSVEHVVVTDCTDVIQIDVQHHHLNQEVVSFTKICQNIRVLLEDAAKEVEEILKKCASGQTIDNKSTSYIFMHKFKYVCASCCQSTSPHYIKLSPANQTLVCCENNTTKYRLLTEQEEVWFKDTNQATEKSRNFVSSSRRKSTRVMSTPAEPDSFFMLPTDTHIQQSLVNDPADIFQSHIVELCDIISSDVVAVCNACASFELIGPETRSYIITAKGASDYDKATKLLYDIELQLKSCMNKQEYLSNVIEAFLCVNNSNLSIVAEELKKSCM